MSFPVLLIDDDATVTNALDRALTLQFDVTTDNSAKAALNRLAETRTFPVIVTDLRMPEMDGIEFIECARRISPDSVFVVLTGSQDTAACEYIQKSDSVFQTAWKPTKKAELIKVILAAYSEFERRQNASSRNISKAEELS